MLDDTLGRHLRPPPILLTFAVLLMLAHSASAQQAPPTAGAGTGAVEPTWTKRLLLADGRTFITDGAFAIDASIARPAALPAVVLPAESAALIDGYLQAPFTAEIRSAALTARRRHYAAPDGTLLNSRYVDYLRRTVADNKLRFRVKGASDPIVVAVEGRPIAVLMPMAQ